MAKQSCKKQSCGRESQNPVENGDSVEIKNGEVRLPVRSNRQLIINRSIQND
jgi:hypothetical protein